MRTRLHLALASCTILILSACGGADDASSDAEANSVEIPATQALEGVSEQPVPDEEAALPDGSEAVDEAPSQEPEA